MDVTQFLLVAPVLLFSLVAHEYAHGYAALRQGDRTALQLGRLTFNPVKHIDPFMTVLVPVMLYFAGGPIFGGAKPVPVETRNFKHFKRGDIIVSLAGVATNVAIAAVCTVLIPPLGLLARTVPFTAPTCAILQHMAVNGIAINLLLAAFNLLPIPPLDGSHVAKYLLPPAWSLQYQRAGRYGLLLLMLALWVGQPIIGAWMRPAFALTDAAISAVGGSVLPAPWH